MLKIVTPLFLLVCFSVCTLGSYHSIPADHQGKKLYFDSKKDFRFTSLFLDHPGKCWFAEKEVEMNVGDKLTSTKLPCVQYKCMKSGDAFYFDRAGYVTEAKYFLIYVIIFLKIFESFKVAPSLEYFVVIVFKKEILANLIQIVVPQPSKIKARYV